MKERQRALRPEQRDALREMAKWQPRAACAGMNPEEFMPATGADGATGLDKSDAARVHCKECEVQEACLECAIRLGPAIAIGVWGGTTDRERQKLRRRRQLPQTA